jgi:hypothetical protein
MSDFKGRNGVLGPSGLSPADLSKDEAKKIKEAGLLPHFKTRPHIGELFSSAYFILHEQMRMFTDKLLSGESLKETEIRAFTGLAKVLTDLSREERAQLEQMGEEVLTTDELMKLAREAGLLPEEP